MVRVRGRNVREACAERGDPVQQGRVGVLVWNAGIPERPPRQVPVLRELAREADVRAFDRTHEPQILDGEELADDVDVESEERHGATENAVAVRSNTGQDTIYQTGSIQGR